MCSKLPPGGGDETCHSRPRDCHGFPVSGSRTITDDQMTLITKIRIEKPSTKEEMDTQSLSVCRFRAYSNTRRGWPSRATANNGRQGELKPTTMIQKWILPSVWFSLIPSILGSQ